MTLTDDAIDRIVKAVGREPIGQPDEEDTFVGKRPDSRDLLGADLQSLANFHRTGSDIRKKPAKRYQDIDRAIAKAKELKSDAEAILGIRFKRHRPALDLLIADLDDESSLAYDPVFGVADGSAFDTLVGRGLKHVFEKHFHQKATYVRDRTSDWAEGAFLDFAEAVLQELNITKSGQPYARNTIAAALSKARRHG
jgi:hypothetical protein